MCFACAVTDHSVTDPKLMARCTHQNHFAILAPLSSQPPLITDQKAKWSSANWCKRQCGQCLSSLWYLPANTSQMAKKRYQHQGLQGLATRLRKSMHPSGRELHAPDIEAIARPRKDHNTGACRLVVPTNKS